MFPEKLSGTVFPMTTEHDFVTAKQAAEILGRSLSRVHHYTEVGRLPVAFQGEGRTATKLFSRAAVEALAAELAEAAA